MDQQGNDHEVTQNVFAAFEEFVLACLEAKRHGLSVYMSYTGDVEDTFGKEFSLIVSRKYRPKE